MEHTNINIDTNAKWAHAQSAVEKISRKARLAELDYMRQLFNDRLPVGEELTDIQSYFDHLEQVILSDKAVNNEQFEPELQLIDPETGDEIPYRYNSADVHYQRALEGGGKSEHGSDQSHLQKITCEPDMDHSSPSGGCDDVQDQSAQSPHFSHLAKRQGRLDSIYEELGLERLDDDDDTSGKLGCCRPG